MPSHLSELRLHSPFKHWNSVASSHRRLANVGLVVVLAAGLLVTTTPPPACDAFDFVANAFEEQLPPLAHDASVGYLSHLGRFVGMHVLDTHRPM